METFFPILLQLVLLLSLVFLSAFFSGSETALFSLSRARLLAYRKEKSTLRRMIVNLMETYNTTLIALILGNMFVNVGISILSDGLIDRLELGYVLTGLISVSVAVVLLLFFGEVTPKTIALLHAEGMSDIVAGPIWFFKWTMTPFIKVVNAFFSLVLDMLGRKTPAALNHDEYATFLEIAGAHGAFSEDETQLLASAFALRKKTVGEVMTPRIDIKSVKTSAVPREIKTLIREHRRSFMPVIKEDLDDADFLLSSKDYFSLTKEERKNWRQSPCLFPAMFVPENSNLTKALRSMREQSASAALVTDEYGGICGMISLEDIYEEMVGELDDEHETPDWELRKIGKNKWEMAGMVPIYVAEEISGWKAPEEAGANTLNGLFCEKLGRLPQQGDRIKVNGLRLEALIVIKHRVTSFKASLKEKTPSVEQGDGAGSGKSGEGNEGSL